MGGPRFSRHRWLVSVRPNATRCRPEDAHDAARLDVARNKTLVKLVHPAPRKAPVSTLLIRLVCGLLSVAMVLGAVVHPPADLTQGLFMLMPVGMMLNYAIRGPRRSLMRPRRASVPAQGVMNTSGTSQGSGSGAR